MSKTRKFAILGLVSLWVAIGAAGAHSAAQTGSDYGSKNPPASGSFPPAGIDLVSHDLRIDVLQVGSTGEKLLETLSFEGRMLLERGDPYINPQGLRQIDFVVQSWEAFAWSRALDTVVIYRLSPDTEQQTSTIVAESTKSDFPATFTFNVVFDAIANGQVVFRRHHGRPKGHGFHQVPPTGNRRLSPTITGFEDQLIELDHPTLGRLRFRPKDCNDQNSRVLANRGGDRPAQGSR